MGRPSHYLLDSSTVAQIYDHLEPTTHIYSVHYVRQGKQYDILSLVLVDDEEKSGSIFLVCIYAFVQYS